jgi:GMP synthase (glutamine-hydrolysing)
VNATGAIVLQHMDREGPGLIADLCAARGLAMEVVRLDRGARVPADVPDGYVLVVMGGSMGVADVGDARYGHLADELSLLRGALSREQPVLGVCLGAQLLASAAGARVYPNRRMGVDGIALPAPEVGFGTVHLLARGRERVLDRLPAVMPVLHWHGDTFELPNGAVQLARSDDCEMQAFRLGKRSFGLQFHVETDAAMVRTWAREDAAFATAALGPEGPPRIIAASEAGTAAMREPAGRLLANLLDAMTAC